MGRAAGEPEVSGTGGSASYNKAAFGAGSVGFSGGSAFSTISY